MNRAAYHSAENGLNYSGLWKLNFYEGATVLAIVWKYGADLREWAESPEFQRQQDDAFALKFERALSEAFTGIPKSTQHIKKSDRPAFE